TREPSRAPGGRSSIEHVSNRNGTSGVGQLDREHDALLGECPTTEGLPVPAVLGIRKLVADHGAEGHLRMNLDDARIAVCKLGNSPDVLPEGPSLLRDLQTAQQAYGDRVSLGIARCI